MNPEPVIIKTEKLEGFVCQINDDTLVVDFYDVNDKNRAPSYQAELQKSSFSDFEPWQLKVGAKIQAKLNKILMPNGVEEYNCKANLILEPQFTAEEIKEAYKEVNVFLDGIWKT